MALDECRAAYQVNHWHPGNPHDPEALYNQKTDVREVWFAGCHSGIPSFPRCEVVMNLTKSYRRWWRIGPERDEKQPR